MYKIVEEKLYRTVTRGLEGVKYKIRFYSQKITKIYDFFFKSVYSLHKFAITIFL